MCVCVVGAHTVVAGCVARARSPPGVCVWGWMGQGALSTANTLQRPKALSFILVNVNGKTMGGAAVRYTHPHPLMCVINLGRVHRGRPTSAGGGVAAGERHGGEGQRWSMLRKQLVRRSTSPGLMCHTQLLLRTRQRREGKKVNSPNFSHACIGRRDTRGVERDAIGMRLLLVGGHCNVLCHCHYIRGGRAGVWQRHAPPGVPPESERQRPTNTHTSNGSRSTGYCSSWLASTVIL